MTTTTTKDAKQKSSKEVDGEWADAAQATSDSDHPGWAPQLSAFKEEVVREKMALMTEGSHANPVLVGTLVIANAFGEGRYFVDEEIGGGKTRRMALPLHGALTSTLDRVRMTPAPRVRLAYMGEAKRARPGERAAIIYDVRVLPKDALGIENRTDPAPLFETQKANKEKRKGKRDGKDKHDDATDAAD